jgi:hypothetical protein
MCDSEALAAKCSAAEKVWSRYRVGAMCRKNTVLTPNCGKEKPSARSMRSMRSMRWIYFP